MKISGPRRFGVWSSELGDTDFEPLMDTDEEEFGRNPKGWDFPASVRISENQWFKKGLEFGFWGSELGGWNLDH